MGGILLGGGWEESLMTGTLRAGHSSKPGTPFHPLPHFEIPSQYSKIKNEQIAWLHHHNVM